MGASHSKFFFFFDFRNREGLFKATSKRWSPELTGKPRLWWQPGCPKLGDLAVRNILHTGKLSSERMRISLRLIPS